MTARGLVCEGSVLVSLWSSPSVPASVSPLCSVLRMLPRGLKWGGGGGQEGKEGAVVIVADNSLFSTPALSFTRPWLCHSSPRALDLCTVPRARSLRVLVSEAPRYPPPKEGRAMHAVHQGVAPPGVPLGRKHIHILLLSTLPLHNHPLSSLSPHHPLHSLHPHSTSQQWPRTLKKTSTAAARPPSS